MILTGLRKERETQVLNLPASNEAFRVLIAVVLRLRFEGRGKHYTHAQVAKQREYGTAITEKGQKYISRYFSLIQIKQL